MPLITAAIIGAAGSAISGAASASASRKNAQAKLDQEQASAQATADAQNRLLGSLQSGTYAGGYGLESVFGSKPYAVPATDIGQVVSEGNAQLNKQGLPNALRGASKINRQVTADALISGFDRARALDQNYDANAALVSNNANQLLQGIIPQDVQDQIASARASIGASNGTPGGTGPVTSKEFGLTSLNLQQQGAGLFAQFHNTLNAISPVQATRGGEALLPYTALQAGQRGQLELMAQQQAQEAANIEASADPAAYGLFAAELGIAGNAGAREGGTAPSNFGNALLGGVGQGISAYGGYLQQDELASRQAARVASYNSNYPQPQYRY